MIRLAGLGLLGLLILGTATAGLIVGIYLIAKGFKPSHVLYDDGRHTGVDGPLIPVRATAELVAEP